MEITKLFRPYNGEQLAMAQIHSNIYDSSLEHINNMTEILKKDFPQIKNHEIKIHKFAGQRIKGVTLVEVQLGKSSVVPEGYFEISQIEFIQ